MFKKTVCLSLLSAVLALSSAGCYGPFKLTKKLHKFNGEVENKWAREGVFVVMVIVPVYGITLLADGIVFNSVQFWTGRNPVDNAALDSQRERRGPRKTVMLQPSVGRMDLAAYGDVR